MRMSGINVLSSKVGLNSENRWEENLAIAQKGTFGTNISFDIEETSAPVRRRSRQQNNQNDVKNDEEENLTGCPGCGSPINQEEWLDCLVGFVSVRI